ncbi:MAG: hypothetical protein AB1724_15930 [Thermodesulfobacteriota bacterium]
MKSVFHFKDTLRLLYPVRVLALGLAVSQVIATVLVYLSNRALAAKIAAIQAAGYGPLPGVNIDPSLTSFEAAFAGGSFFTLSTGAGVTMLTFGATLLFSSLAPLYRAWKTKSLKAGWRIPALLAFLPATVAAAILIIAWPVLLIWANRHGLCPGMTAFLVLVPPPVIWAATKWSPRKSGYTRLPWRTPIHFMLIAFLLALWGWQVNKDVFINFRDNLLLTSGPGTRIVDFYYRYTLYPAEVFKRLADRQLKACVLEGFADPAESGRLETVLRAHDYFVVPAGAVKPDLTLIRQGNGLALARGGKPVITVERERFMRLAGDILDGFSEKVDHQFVFRRFTLVSLAGVAPLALYLAVYGLFCLVPGILINVRISSFLAPVLCFIFWAGVILYLGPPPPARIDADRAAAAIREGSRKERIAALRYIDGEKLDIGRFEGYQRLIDTTDPAQLYWLARTLGSSRDPAAGIALFRFLNSDSAYIVCKAMSSIARQAEKQGDPARRRTRNMLVRKMEMADNWYIQFSAYKAARSLGWMPGK